MSGAGVGLVTGAATGVPETVRKAVAVAVQKSSKNAACSSLGVCPGLVPTILTSLLRA